MLYDFVNLALILEQSLRSIKAGANSANLRFFAEGDEKSFDYYATSAQASDFSNNRHLEKSEAAQQNYEEHIRKARAQAYLSAAYATGALLTSLSYFGYLDTEIPYIETEYTAADILLALSCLRLGVQAGIAAINRGREA